METRADSGDSKPGRSVAGFYALGAAGLLLAAVVVSNALSDGDSAEPQATIGPMANGIEALRRAAEASADDARPWQELGFAYFERGEYAEAVRAYERAVTIDGGEAVLWSALGEARVMASARDPMPPAALDAFNRASQIDPKDPRARYFLNVQKDLSGDHAGAISGWLALLADSPEGAPWESDLIRTIEQVGKLKGIEVQPRIAQALAARPKAAPPAPAPTRGPSAQDIAAAGSIPPSEQRAMAESMVARLEERLRADPSDPAGWLMLIRSRMTLGEPDRARAALEQAVRANPADAARLRQEAAAMGLR
ncbi:tetratricopeptide repeat protein [Porphyrobacter sp. LM 6]|uniref:tetratricopeptide repeat protein n=1 Tax=Porphyrobacter sp. LM 6 TaxID=1896196 RepID=UPI000863B273|nr:tetratricopeptide repeat protein [Porphyrobacter sp. LM 6]AOL93808.1 cytochrome c-type biogenesis protein CcmH [Porphyrobacter sp. LM 6]